MIQDIKHSDGIWHTTEHFYEGYKYVIKSREGSGMKVHILNADNTKVIKTFRWSLVKASYAGAKAKQFIDNLK